MDVRKIVVVVEDVDISRKALQWSLHNLLRYGDLLTLLHVFTATKSTNKKKARLLRLQGYQLALSFKEICNSNFFNTNIEMVVTEGDQEGRKIVAMVREIGASVLVVGLHHESFLYRLALGHDNIANSLSCRVLAIKQPELSPPPPLRAKTRERLPPLDSSTTMDFSQIEISGLHVPDIPPPKIPYRICPSPSAIIWRPRGSRKKKSRSNGGA
ncbi:hypothetical protein ES319_D12G293300v1 [Gossypium barbadense]|uniref:UspA domain-containing protein n=2 Tax=Gossypium TaxID=3633 RepID=A0A5J5P4E2_GOSBA|nr:hypothetical protein ES319_D12G293300v1 [Gossypium barbadense]PPE00059.1 hypothetical protein GOBAR_DD02916 [Gossypium barbadense]TYG43086.1 hypothetical protein ES288_D12G308900v1 [Gossypium darwinii]